MMTPKMRLVVIARRPGSESTFVKFFSSSCTNTGSVVLFESQVVPFWYQSLRSLTHTRVCVCIFTRATALSREAKSKISRFLRADTCQTVTAPFKGLLCIFMDKHAQRCAHVCERFNDIVVGSLHTLKSDIDAGNSIKEPTARARCVLCVDVVVSASIFSCI